MSTVSSKKEQQSSSKCLTDLNDQILQLWAEKVREAVPAAESLAQRELYNSVPQFLKKLSDIISSAGAHPNSERFPNELIDVCREHGAQRAGVEAYTLDQVITEHRLLRETILDVFDKQTCSLNKSELSKLLEAIDYAIVQSASEFAAKLGFEKARRVNELETEVNHLKSERVLRESFVATLTHDLRTPLTAIKASGEVILKMAEDENLTRTLAARIVEGAIRVDKMIRDLLDANRIRAGQQLPLRVAHCDFSEILRSSLDDLKSVHGERFEVVAPRSLTGYWSADELQRVIENLALNALKYGDSLAPIVIKLEEVGQRVRLSVHNDGKAINESDQELLFKQFERGFSAKLSGKRGWGIGLTLVRGVAEAHGGKAWVKSAPGEGTTFFVEFPQDARRNAQAA